MRRLPIYLLLDVSGSMLGEPIEALRNGIRNLISSLQNEPQALESVYLSLITFENTAKQVVALTDISSFKIPALNAGGQTALGEALELLCLKIDTEVVKPSIDNKGDWRPIVFLMTDGQPTDDWIKGAKEVKKRKMTLVACAAGFDVDINILRQITESVIQLKDASVSDIGSFFRWLTITISSSSQKIRNTA